MLVAGKRWAAKSDESRVVDGMSYPAKKCPGTKINGTKEPHLKRNGAGNVIGSNRYMYFTDSYQTPTPAVSGHLVLPSPT